MVLHCSSFFRPWYCIAAETSGLGIQYMWMCWYFNCFSFEMVLWGCSSVFEMVKVVSFRFLKSFESIGSCLCLMDPCSSIFLHLILSLQISILLQKTWKEWIHVISYRDKVYFSLIVTCVKWNLSQNSCIWLYSHLRQNFTSICEFTYEIPYLVHSKYCSYHIANKDRGFMF